MGISPKIQPLSVFLLIIWKINNYSGFSSQLKYCPSSLKCRSRQPAPPASAAPRARATAAFADRRLRLERVVTLYLCFFYPSQLSEFNQSSKK